MPKLRPAAVGSVALSLALLGLTAGAAIADSAPTWVGRFADFNTPDWRMRWGIIPDTLTCNIAEGKAPCNWGYPNLKTVDDPTTPGGGPALDVTYPAPSGPPSCNCGIGGAQLYQDLKMAGHAALAASKTIGLKYHYKFPVGFDFGKNTGGKMPGLYGGEPGCESGGQRCPGAWSTRYMWRGGSQASPRGEVYWYSAGGSGFGEDLGLGSWNWKADGQWHAIEQLVDTGTGKITIWHDGAMVFQATKKFPGPATGIFFSTFHGGHDTSWSPSKKTAAQFALFTIGTSGPQAAVAGPTDSVDAGAPGSGADAGGAGGSAGTGGSAGAGGSGPGSSAGAGGTAGAGASPTTGGTTGSGSGTGGTTSPSATGGTPGGSGGSATTTATGGTTNPPPSPDSSSPPTAGCTYAGTRTAPAALAILLSALLLVPRRRRPQ